MLAGQVCSSLTRIVVSRQRHDDSLRRWPVRVSQVRVGDPFDAATQMGPLVSSRQRDRVEGYIAKGKEEGATLVTGGGRPHDLDRGYYVEPTVFAHVDNSSVIAQEEIFGPVLSVIPADNEEHIVALANDTMYGLNASVFTHDVDRARQVAGQLRSGTVGHNAFRTDFSVAFGGFKQSGIGREGGTERPPAVPGDQDGDPRRPSGALPLTPIASPPSWISTPGRSSTGISAALSPNGNGHHPGRNRHEQPLTHSVTTATRVLVVGGATGMGAAAAQLVLDGRRRGRGHGLRRDHAGGAPRAIHVNPGREGPRSTTAVAECGGHVDVLLSCAGVATAHRESRRFNFIGHRHMIDSMLASGMLSRARKHRVHLVGRRARLAEPPGGTGGVPWPHRTGTVPSSGSKRTTRPTTCATKQANLCLPVSSQAFPLLKQASASTASAPARPRPRWPWPTRTSGWAFGADYRADLGIEAATPLEQAYPLVFLCSDAAAGINGIVMVTDAGYFASGITGSYPDASPVTDFLLSL